LMEQNEEWQLQHRYLPQHTMADAPAGTGELPPLPPCLKLNSQAGVRPRNFHHLDGRYLAASDLWPGIIPFRGAK
jgi:hypothetical protein